MFSKNRKLSKLVLLSFILLISSCSNPAGKVASGTVEAPIANPPGGNVAPGTKVTLKCATDGAEIWYTRNGSDPARSVGALYEEPIAISNATTIKAIAVKDGVSSEVIVEAYTVAGEGGGGGGTLGGGGTPSGVNSGSISISVTNPNAVLSSIDPLRVPITVSGLNDANKVTVSIASNAYDVNVEGSNTFGNGSAVLLLAYSGVIPGTSSAETFTLNISSPPGHSYGGGPLDVTANSVLDGMVTGRTIPVTQENITRFNTYANTANGLGRHYKLIEDVTLAPPPPGESNWTAIGNGFSTNFMGSFDGQGHIITGIVINKIHEEYQGLFGATSGASVVIKDIGLIGVNISGAIDVGGIVGTNGSSMVKNCYVTGIVNGALTGVGGVVGSNSGVVKNCFATGNVFCYGQEVGGVVGRNSSGIFENCYATSNVYGYGAHIGGIMSNIGGAVQNCVALNTSVTTTLTFIPTIARVGYNYAGTFSNNYARSDMIVQYDMAGTPTNKILNIGLNTEDGADISPLGAETTQVWWTGTAGWVIHNTKADATSAIQANPDTASPWYWGGVGDPRPKLWFE